MVGIIIGLTIMLADAFFMWCCCRVASMADRAEEEWLEERNPCDGCPFGKPNTCKDFCLKEALEGAKPVDKAK